jgi:hypothetical protein
MSTNKAANTFPFAGILLLIFITLKLAGIGAVATWSWVWVMSPLWIPLAIIAAIFGVALLFILVGSLAGIKKR